MKHILILLAILALTLILTSCDNITEPEDLTPGGRNIKWTEETIITDSYYDYSNYGEIFGSNVDKMWYLCPEPGQLWKYESKTWDRVSFISFFPEHVYYYDGKLMVVSEDMRYCIYNGSSFSEIKEMGIPDHVYITGIYGNNMSDIYAVGSLVENSIEKAVLLHYNGVAWIERKTNFIGSFRWIAKGSNTGILINYLSDFTDSGIYEYTGENYKKISDRNYYAVQIGGILYFSDGSSLYKYKEGKFYSWKSFNAIYTQSIFGKSESDLFYMSYPGLAHYNGRDAALLYPFSNYGFLDSKFIGNDVCCLVYDRTYSQVKLIIGKYM